MFGSIFCKVPVVYILSPKDYSIFDPGGVGMKQKIMILGGGGPKNDDRGVEVVDRSVSIHFHCEKMMLGGGRGPK